MESAFFEKINKKNIFCCLSEAKNNDKKIIIMSHGFRGSSIGPARTFVDFQQILSQEGYSVLRFDQPNGGNSEGDYLESSFNEWIETTSYFVKKYLDLGYKVGLLGQSMGATTSAVVASREEFKDRIPCIVLWVPGISDPKHTINAEEVYEEGGQKYKGRFWLEAKAANFPACLDTYSGAIHLVYGEKDRYISKALREKLIDYIKQKGQSVMILKGQDHSPWEFDIAQQVYKQEMEFIKKNL